MKASFLCRSLMFFPFVFACIPAIAQSASDQKSEIEQLGKLAEANLHAKKFDSAEAEYQKILALEPANTNAHSNLGLAYYLQRQFALAAEQFNIALSAKPDLWNIVALCGLSEARIQQNAKASTHLEQAFVHVTDPALRLTVGKQLFSILSESGDLERAAEVVVRLQQLEPNNADLLYAAHRVYSLLANRAFLSLAYLDPDSARMYQVWGDRMKLMGDAEGAITAYRKAIERNPKLSGVHVALGDVLSASRSASDREAAKAEYRKAVQVDPSDARAESKLGDLAVQDSDLEDALQHYKRALEIQPDDPEANEGMGEVFLESQSYEKARVYLKRTIELDPTNRSAYYHLSQASKKLGDLDVAKREMAEFLKLKAEDQKMRSSFSSLSLGIKEDMPQSEHATSGPVGTRDSQTGPNR